MNRLTCKRIECDEIWSFVGMKGRNVPAELKGVLGDTWTAIDADTKLVPCWHVGTRAIESARPFIQDLAGRLTNHGRTQSLSDGCRRSVREWHWLRAANQDLWQRRTNQGRCAALQPGRMHRNRKNRITGNPDMENVSTSYVERQNLTMRMHMRRFTRLTNAFSRKLENHMHAISLYFMFYNFCKIHKSLRVTPAMEAGITDHVWELEEVIMMSDTNSPIL